MWRGGGWEGKEINEEMVERERSLKPVWVTLVTALKVACVRGMQPQWVHSCHGEAVEWGSSRGGSGPQAGSSVKASLERERCCLYRLQPAARPAPWCVHAERWECSLHGPSVLRCRQPGLPIDRQFFSRLCSLSTWPDPWFAAFCTVLSIGSCFPDQIGSSYFLSGLFCLNQ